MNIRFSKSQDFQLLPILTIKRVKKKILFRLEFQNIITGVSNNVKLLQKMYAVVLNALFIKGS